MIMILETILDSGTVRLQVEGHMEELDFETIQGQLDQYFELRKQVIVDVRNLKNFDIRWHHWIKKIEGDVEWIGLPPYITMDWT